MSSFPTKAICALPARAGKAQIAFVGKLDIVTLKEVIKGD